jgi:peptide-methionine (S)-S-oxide reductase
MGDLRQELLPEREVYHQQYLYKNPGGYCGIGGTGVNAGDPSAWCTIGLTTSSEEWQHFE